MSTTTYRGVKIRVTKGKKYAHLNVVLGGVPQGEWAGSDEAAEIKSWFGYIDDAGRRPEAYPAHFHPTEAAA